MVNLKSDRFVIGFITGTIAGVGADGSNFLSTKVLHFGKFGYEDFASVLIFGRFNPKPE